MANTAWVYHGNPDSYGGLWWSCFTLVTAEAPNGLCCFFLWSLHSPVCLIPLDVGEWGSGLWEQEASWVSAFDRTPPCLCTGLLSISGEEVVVSHPQGQGGFLGWATAYGLIPFAGATLPIQFLVFVFAA